MAIYVTSRSSKDEVANYWRYVIQVVPETIGIQWLRMMKRLTEVYQSISEDDFVKWVEDEFYPKERELFKDVAEKNELMSMLEEILPSGMPRRKPPPPPTPTTDKKKNSEKFLISTSPSTPVQPSKFDQPRTPVTKKQVDVVQKEVQTSPIDMMLATPVVKRRKVLDNNQENNTQREDIIISQRPLTQIHSQFPLEQISKLKVTCPPLPRVQGIYNIQQTVVNEYPWWEMCEPDGSSWKLYSSPRGAWTITSKETDFSTGHGLVVNGTYHGGKPPHLQHDSIWKVAAFQEWRDHPGIKVTSLYAAQAINNVYSKYSNNGFLKKRAVSRLLRDIKKDMSLPPIPEAVWTSFCKQLGCDPAEGIPEERMSELYEQVPQLQTQHLTQLTQSSSSTAKTPDVIRLPCNVQQVSVAPSITQLQNQQQQQEPTVQKQDRFRGHRCGKCQPCLKPSWKKACESPVPVSNGIIQQTEPKSKPVTKPQQQPQPQQPQEDSSSEEEEDTAPESLDKVARLLGFAINRAAATVNQTKKVKRGRVGYAPGKPVVEMVKK